MAAKKQKAPLGKRLEELEEAVRHLAAGVEDLLKGITLTAALAAGDHEMIRMHDQILRDIVCIITGTNDPKAAAVVIEARMRAFEDAAKDTSPKTKN